MNTRKPKLSWHRAKRCWYVRWGGRSGRYVYLGKDKAQARIRYADEMADWAVWRAQRDAVVANRPRRVGG